MEIEHGIIHGIIKRIIHTLVTLQNRYKCIISGEQDDYSEKIFRFVNQSYVFIVFAYCLALGRFSYDVPVWKICESWFFAWILAPNLWSRRSNFNFGLRKKRTFEMEGVFV